MDSFIRITTSSLGTTFLPCVTTSFWGHLDITSYHKLKFEHVMKTMYVYIILVKRQVMHMFVSSSNEKITNNLWL